MLYLPLFELDMRSVVDYISRTLQNPSAANHLIDDVEKAVMDRSAKPLSLTLIHQPKEENNRIIESQHTELYSVIHYIRHTEELK